jgi:uncharacterized membrane protein
MSLGVSRARRRRWLVALAACVLALAVGVASTVAQAHVHVGAAGASSCIGCALAHERSVAADGTAPARVVWSTVGTVADVAADVALTPEGGIPTPRGPPRSARGQDDVVTTVRRI